MTRIIKFLLTVFIVWSLDSTTAASNNYQQLQQSTDNNGDELDEKNVNGKSNNRSSDGFIQVTDDVILVNNLTEDRIIEENRLIQQLNRYNHKIEINLDNKSLSKKYRSKKARKRKSHKKKLKRIKSMVNDTLSPELSNSYTKDNKNDSDLLPLSLQKETIIVKPDENDYDRTRNAIQKDVEMELFKNNRNIASSRSSSSKKDEQKADDKTIGKQMKSAALKKRLKKFNKEKLFNKSLKPSEIEIIEPEILSALNETSEKPSTTTRIIIGDLSCMKNEFKPAPPISHADIKYLRNDMYGIENSFLEAEYHCHIGYKLKLKYANGNSSNLICRKNRWIGKRPECTRVKKVKEENPNRCRKNNSCDQICSLEDGVEICSCRRGFRMVDDRCVDINECKENEDVCEYGCSNTIGSFTCKCPKGLRVTDNNKCMDINECLLRNGHGPCQDVCINTWSSYRCACDRLSGTKLANDGHSCEDVDECSINNGGCSHTCLNTLGRAFCVCPDGYMLDEDWKTCIDIDECANQNALKLEKRCNSGCLNTPGSYRCINDDEINADEPQILQKYTENLADMNDSDDNDDDDTLCPNGYTFNTTMGDCQDVNECNADNGGCQHHCINVDGSFYCSCKYGFKLDMDRHTCIILNASRNLVDVACPPLFPPRHGYLECSRPIDEISDGPNGGRARITNRPGSQCILKCPTGYRLEGKFSKICGTSGEWIGEGEGMCIRYPTPKLICPENMIVELHPNETLETNVKIKRPKTDVNWERDVLTEPFWAKKDVLALKVGKTNITYTAKHPISKLTSSCNFSINVLEGKPPSVDFCPETQIYTIEGRHESVKASWDEPIFTDNVNIATITKSNTPGTDFGAGHHQITYEAQDQAGWTGKCVFKIVVNYNKRKDASHFQLPILYNRFYF